MRSATCARCTAVRPASGPPSGDGPGPLNTNVHQLKCYLPAGSGAARFGQNTYKVRFNIPLPSESVVGERDLISQFAAKEEEIRKGIQGNICRCTGYVNIVEAIKEAAE